MGQYGMPLLGLLKMVNTKPITDINPLSEGSQILKQRVALPTHRHGATLSRPLQAEQEVLAGGNKWP